MEFECNAASMPVDINTDPMQYGSAPLINTNRVNNLIIINNLMIHKN